jgi:hypothetical protein
MPIVQVMDDIETHWRGRFRRYPPAPEYVGLTLEEARSRAAAGGAVNVREVVLGRNLAMRLDLRPSRLNLLVRDGLVIEASFF